MVQVHVLREPVALDPRHVMVEALVERRGIFLKFRPRRGKSLNLDFQKPELQSALGVCPGAPDATLPAPLGAPPTWLHRVTPLL